MDGARRYLLACFRQSSKIKRFCRWKEKKMFGKKGKELAHYCFEVFVGGFDWHYVEFVNEYFEYVWGYECG
jgi:hypothetical protein